MTSYTALAVALLLVLLPLLYSAARWLRSTLRPSKYPPGPPTLLGLGNLHQIPRLWSHLKLDSWAKEFGPITGLKLGPLNVVVLNDASLVHELIVKRAASFSERPSVHIAQEHILPEAKHSYTLFMRNDYGNRLRAMSKQLLVGSGLSNVAPLQQAAGTRLVYNLLEPGDDWMEHLKPWALSTPVAMLSGAPIEEYVQDFGKRWIDDYWLSQQLWIELLDPINPPVDLFPVLRWVPSMFAKWKRKAPIARKYLIQAYEGLMDQSRKSLERRGGSFSSLSMIPKLLRESPDLANAKAEMERTTFMGGVFDAAVGSSVMSFQTLILALAAHPDAQRRAQAEIDAILGEDSPLPEHIDLGRLRYVNACVLESQRWRPLGAFPVGAFGLPRKSVVDEEVLGYRIPKGSSVLLNQWTIAHDPDFYEEPERYKPDRFIRDSVGAKEGVRQEGRKAVYTFGAGRRECLGKNFALQNIGIALSQILWAFDIVPAESLNIDAQTGFTPAVVMVPKPFKVKFVPRKSQEALLEEKRKADVILSEILGEKA